jgi:hypothetical protein
MDVLVMLEDHPEHQPLLAHVESVPMPRGAARPARDVVTLYGDANVETLALALAAAVESRRVGGERTDSVRHVGVWPGRGAVGDAAWRDASTGELVTRDLEIPFETLFETARDLLAQSGQAIRRVLAGLMMPDWPEGTRRALTLSLAPARTSGAVAIPAEAFLDRVREADALTYDSEDQ